MGVHGLWQLLAPVGHRVSNDHVRNKVLAVDVSIWLTQLVKAMRDAEGARVRNAHLIGVFRRCIKLLFLCVRPVLIFDGATPSIKRRTVAARRAQREKHEAKLRRLAEKILVNRIKKKAVGDAILRKHGSHEESDTLKQTAAKHSVETTSERHIPANTKSFEEDEIQPVFPDAQPSDTSRKKFGVSDVRNKQLRNKSFVQNSTEAANEAEHFVQNNNSDNEQIVLPNDLQDLDDAALVDLPAHLQSKVFKQIKHEQRLRHRENMLQQRDNPTEFSKTQIEGFLRHTALNRKISNVRNVINDHSGVRNRIASDSRREFVFEEFKESNQDQFDLDSDSEDDILHPSAKKRSVMDAKDLLSKIRSAKEQNNEFATLRSATAIEKRNREERLSSGVGWASNVLSGSGGLQLSRMTTGATAFGQIPRSPSEEDDEDVEEVLGLEKPNDIPPDESRQGAMDPTPGEENGSDSDDVEWEDGAANSDSENSNKSFGLDECFEERAEKARDVSKGNSFIGSVPAESNDFSNGKDVIDNMDEPDESRQASELNMGEEPAEEHIKLDSSHDIRDEERQVSTERMDVKNGDADPAALGEQSFRQGGMTKRASSLSPPPVPADEEILKLNKKKTSALKTQLVNTPASELRRLPSSYVQASRDTTAKQQISLESDMDKSHNPSDNTLTDSTGQKKTTTENSSTRRKSRTVNEEDNDIQLAIALSLKENVPNAPLSVDKNGLPCDAHKCTRDENNFAPQDKNEGPTGGRRESVHNFAKGSDHQVYNTRRDTSTKSADASGVEAEGASDSLGLVHEGQDAEGEMTLMEMERLYADLDTEAQEFQKQRGTHVGAVETISDEMYGETRDLLKLLGIPYLEAPMEAEAQCAFLNMEKIVDGVITEDSDAFLFGAEVVYRQLFADGRFAETYDAQDIKSSLGLDRDQLIRLAHLLGSDYTPGVRGVGIVNAMEIMEAFPGEQGLSEFLEWTKKVTVLDKEPEESVMTGTSAEAVRRRFCWKHRNMKRNWVIREGFPSRAVSEAYLKPTIDNNKGRFKWRDINFDGLARFCWEKFGWEQNAFENAVGPLRKELAKRKGPQQTRIPEFFKPHRFAKIRSKRLQQAVKGITGDEVEEIMASIVPRIKRRKTSAMTFNAAIDLSPEEEEQVLKLLEETETRTKSGRRRAGRNQ
ncbi:DNA repair protein complementing XPG RAD2 [Gracilaria domingensis]|nr:DNA repair protein complementing XPG RAD2 [Gracilaria domingensis]